MRSKYPYLVLVLVLAIAFLTLVGEAWAPNVGGYRTGG
jgi:hypothetical protein